MFWQHKQQVVQTVPAGPVLYTPLPLEATRNDGYAGGYPPYPVGKADWGKYYNNTYWGNRLPDSGNGIGIPGYNNVSQAVFWTQYSPEQTAIANWQLRGAQYPYYLSVQGSANILQQMSQAWRNATTTPSGGIQFGR